MFSFFSFSQNKTIEGKLYNRYGQPINGSLLIKKIKSPQTIIEYHLIRNGKFSYRLKNNYQENLILEITSIGYQSYSEVINIKKSSSTIYVNAQLLKSEITELEEVVVKGKKRPYKIKNDTIEYDVEAYKSGTERKVEDLLKNLPGIEVDNKTGKIKYNGKPIETVMLEGDNLFGYNYTLGTKNINIDIVQSVEAIENYSENKLLKGIENSEKVALNLKLKSDKLDFSGGLDINGGHSNDKLRSNSSTNLLAINKFFKSFGIMSFNNIGINTSPFDFLNPTDNLEYIKELNYKANKIIPETLFLNSLDEKRTNINNLFFSNYNAIFNFNESLKAKTNLYYSKNTINNFENTINSYSIGDNQFKTYDNKVFSTTPEYYRGDLKLDYYPSKNSILEYKLSLRNEEIKTNNTINSNIRDNTSSYIKSDNVFILQNALFTKKLSRKKVLQVNLVSSTNSVKQNLTLTPSLYDGNSDEQKIALKKEFFKFKSTLLGSESSHKYKFSVGGNISKNPLKTDFISLNNSDTTINGINQIDYKTKEIYALAEDALKIKHFTIKPNVKLRYLNQTILDGVTKNSELINNIIFEPSLRLSYQINRNSNIQTNYSLNKKTNNISWLFNNDILINNRSILKSESNLRLQKNENFNLSYSNTNLFSQLQLRIGIHYNKQKGNYFANSLINENIVITNYFFLNENTETFDFNIYFAKYIPFLKLNIKTNSFYSINNYKNIINNSNLRSNKSYLLTNEIFLKTAFKSNFNFENETIFKSNKTISEYKFSNYYLQNKFRLIYQPSNKFISSLTLDHFIPDLNEQVSNIALIDSRISYIIKKNWEINLTATNLTNVKTFTTIQNNDTSTNSYSVGLLQRYFILGLSWTF